MSLLIGLVSCNWHCSHNNDTIAVALAYIRQYDSYSQMSNLAYQDDRDRRDKDGAPNLQLLEPDFLNAAVGEDVQQVVGLEVQFDMPPSEVYTHDTIIL